MTFLPKKKKRYLPTQIFGLAAILLLFAIATTLPNVYAATPVINNTGISINGIKANPTTFSTVLCTGSSTSEDTINQYLCTDICYSTSSSSQCGNTSKNALAKNGSVYIRGAAF